MLGLRYIEINHLKRKEKAVKVNYKTVTYWIVFGVMVFSAIFWTIIFQRSNAEAKENVKMRAQYRATMESAEKIRTEKIRGIEKRLGILESSVRRFRIRTEEDPTTIDPKPSVDSQSDDLAVNLESMNDREYQAWIMEHANASDRQILAEHFQRENEFKASLNPTQKKAFEDAVEKEYAKALKEAKSKGEISDLRKIALKQSTESMVIARWKMQETRERMSASTVYSDEELRLLKDALAKEIEVE